MTCSSRDETGVPRRRPGDRRRAAPRRPRRRARPDRRRRTRRHASTPPRPIPTPRSSTSRGCVISPGFIDLQCNGAVGVDITTDPGGIDAVARALPRFGVTSFLPTVVTSPAANRRAAIDALVALRDAEPEPSDPVGADPIGLHLEGPMISRAASRRTRTRTRDGTRRRRTRRVGDVARGSSGHARTGTPRGTRSDRAPDPRRHHRVGRSHGDDPRRPRGGAGGRTVLRDAPVQRDGAVQPSGARPDRCGSRRRRPWSQGSSATASTSIRSRCAWRGVHSARRVCSWCRMLVGALGAPFGRMQLGGLEMIHDASRRANRRRRPRGQRTCARSGGSQPDGVHGLQPRRRARVRHVDPRRSARPTRSGPADGRHPRRPHDPRSDRRTRRHGDRRDDRVGTLTNSPRHS